MFDDDFEWDRDEIVDLDVTGDPQLDQFGYQSPRRDFSQPSEQRDWLAQAKRDQRQREQRREEARRRRELPPSHHGIVLFPPGMNYQRGIGPIGSQSVNEGWSRPVVPPQPLVAEHPVPPPVPRGRGAGGRSRRGRTTGGLVSRRRDAGRSHDVDAVDQPGDGPQMTVQQSPAPQWHTVELTEPGPGTQVW